MLQPQLGHLESVPKASNINAGGTGGIVSVDVLDHVAYSDGTTVKLKNNLQYDRRRSRAGLRLWEHGPLPSIQRDRQLPHHLYG